MVIERFAEARVGPLHMELVALVGGVGGLTLLDTDSRVERRETSDLAPRHFTLGADGAARKRYHDPSRGLDPGTFTPRQEKQRVEGVGAQQLPMSVYLRRTCFQAIHFQVLNEWRMGKGRVDPAAGLHYRKLPQQIDCGVERQVGIETPAQVGRRKISFSRLSADVSFGTNDGE